MHHAHVAARKTVAPSTNLIDMSAFKSIRFRFSQAQANRLLGTKKAAILDKKKRPANLKKRRKLLDTVECGISRSGRITT
jgi:hypothetical protein